MSGKFQKIGRDLSRIGFLQDEKTAPQGRFFRVQSGASGHHRLLQLADGILLQLTNAFG